MHRIIALDGTYRQSTWLRIVRTVAYLSWAIAGLLLFISPTVHDVYGHDGLAMSAFLYIGGVFSATGSASQRWIGEFTGLPLVGTGFAVLGILIFKESYDTTPLLAWGNLMFLSGFACYVSARYRMIIAIFRLAHHVAEQREKK